jgi:hypothetical protein
MAQFGEQLVQVRSDRPRRKEEPDLERFMAKRMNATTIEVNSGHLSLVTHPETIARLILQAAATS